MFICSKMFTRCPRDNTVMMICFYSVLRYLLLFLGVCLPVCLSLQTASLKLLSPPPPLLPISLSLAPDHSRSEMDLSAPGSEPSDDALSLRSRSVPGLNETVSAINPSPLAPHIWLLWQNSLQSTITVRLFDFSVHSSPLLIHTSTVL